MEKIGRDYRLPRELENLVVFLFQTPVCCVMLNPLAFVLLWKNEKGGWLFGFCNSVIPSILMREMIPRILMREMRESPFYHLKAFFRSYWKVVPQEDDGK